MLVNIYGENIKGAVDGGREKPIVAAFHARYLLAPGSG